MPAPPPAFSVLLFATALLTGCTTVQESFVGEQPGRVWTALVAVALTPDYGDPDPKQRWSIRENEVWVDRPSGRIEIYREITRTRDITSVRPKTTRRDFRFRVTLDLTEGPVATFQSRGTAVPKHATLEGERYFRDVWTLLRPPEMGPRPGLDGATSPREAVREFLRGVLMRDETTIRRVIVDHPDADVLWTGEPALSLPIDAQVQLRRQVIRSVQPGDEILVDGKLVLVTPDMVNDQRKILVANVAGAELAPFVVVRVDRGWRVDAAPIIERQTGR